MTASLLMLLVAVMCFIIVCAAVSGCATFVNRGDAFSQSNDHFPDPKNMVRIEHCQYHFANAGNMVKVQESTP
jgi:hypothetical protein